MKRPQLKRPNLRVPRRKKGPRTATKRLRAPRSLRLPGRMPKAEKAQPAANGKKKEPATGLWFRASTRVRAVGYWLREKGQIGRRYLGKGGEQAKGAAEWVADLWLKRSDEERIRIVAVAGVLTLYAVVKFAPVPGVPCQVSAAKECAPPNDTIALVPADALLYAHVTIDEDSTQYKRATDAFNRLADLGTILASEIPGALPTPSGVQLDIAEDVLPWADQDLAVTLLPGPKSTARPVFIVGVGDKEGADQFLTTIAPPGEQPRSKKQGSAALSVYKSGFATAYVGDNLAFGDEAGVRAVIDVRAGAVDQLDGSPQNAPRDELPDARFAEIYLSQAGVRQLLANRTGAAVQLETFVDYAATQAIAAGLVARPDGLEVDLVSELDPNRIKQNPSFFSSLPDFEPALADEAGERTIGYVGVGDLGPSATKVLDGGGKQAQGLIASLQALAGTLEQESGVNPLRDLLPALGGQAAIVAEPTDGVPFASLIVDDVDEKKAAEALAGLQKPLLEALNPPGGARVPRFEQSEVEGVKVFSVQASPTVNLAYGLFDGKLVISTGPAGIAQVRSDADGLADSGPYEKVTDDLPDEVSALVFLNLDELFGQIRDRANLAEDPFFANLSVLFENASSLGLAVNGSDERIRTELFLALD